MAAPRSVTVACAVCEVHAEAVFRVEGLDCNDEVVILERRLKPIAGVEAISADVVGQRLRVSYDAAKLDTAAMVDAVAEAGMRMWLEHEEPRAQGADVAARFWFTAASGTALAAGAAAAAAGYGPASIAAYVAGTIVGGIFPARRAVGALRARTLDINALMVIAAAGALAIGEWREGATVVFLFALAQWLEARTLARARGAIRALLDLSPRDALVRRGGVDQRIPVEDVATGDLVIVRPGDKIAVDGRVSAGQSDVNESPITGESLPADKGPGAEVYAGTINGHGALEVTVTRVGRDTRVARIIHLVEEAQAQRAPIQSFVDRFGRVYTPAVIVAALAVAIVPPLAGAPALDWVYRALVLLVVSCPCALVISTPVSIVAAVSAAASRGVLIKGGAALERLAAVRALAFDKTGTLTSGELEVAGVEAVAPRVRGDEVLAAAAALESQSTHPIGPRHRRPRAARRRALAGGERRARDARAGRRGPGRRARGGRRQRAADGRARVCAAGRRRRCRPRSRLRRGGWPPRRVGVARGSSTVDRARGARAAACGRRAPHRDADRRRSRRGAAGGAGGGRGRVPRRPAAR